MQIEEPVVFQEQVEKLKDNSKIKKKTDAPRNVVNADTLKWSKQKQKDHAKEYSLCRKILFTKDGTTDVKNPLKLFYDYSDFSILFFYTVTITILITILFFYTKFLLYCHRQVNRSIYWSYIFHEPQKTSSSERLLEN